MHFLDPVRDMRGISIVDVQILPTFPGYYSWRNMGNGSWFIQAVCAVFNQYGSTLELMQLMTRVNYLVAQFHSMSKDPELSNKKQIPDITTRLTKEVFFTKQERVLE